MFWSFLISLLEASFQFTLSSLLLDPPSSIHPAKMNHLYNQSQAGPSTAPSSSPSTSTNSPAPNGTGRNNNNGAIAGPSTSTSAASSLGPLIQTGQNLNEFLESFWTRQMDHVERENPDFRTFPLPLARIKKVQKSDEEVKVGSIGVG